MTAPPSPVPGSLLLAGRYKVLSKLGSGRLGAVYLADDQELRMRVALKLIHPGRGQAELESIRAEFRALASLRHPQIARAFDFGYIEPGRAFYTREYVDGTPLRPGPPPHGALEPARSFLSPLFDLLEALHYLHAQGILHLDVHPGNLIEAEDGNRGGVLIDFGFRRSLHSGESTPGLDVLGGIPPELATGRPVGQPTDVYAACRLLLHRLTGERRTEAALPRVIPGWGERLTLKLERIVAKGLQDDPARRFQSAEELRAALLEALGERGATGRPGEPRDVLVGLAAEIRLLEQCLGEASRGAARAAWFTGPAGLGKSSLLREAQVLGQIHGLDVVTVQFLGDAMSGPTLLGALEAHRSTDAGSKAWLESFAVRHGGSTGQRARRAAESYFSQRGAPLALLIDDVDSADRESALLIDALLRETVARRASPASRGLAVVLAGTSAPARDRVPRGARNIVRCLHPLSRASSRQLLQSLLGDATLSEMLVRKIVASSRGLPLSLRRMAQELLRVRAESGRFPGTIPLAGTRAQLQFALPPSTAAHGSLERVLQALAVLGWPASAEEISAASASPLPQTRALLRRLEAADLAAHFGEGRSRRFHLAHPQAAASILRSVSAKTVRSLRARMALRLQKKPANDLRSRANLVRLWVALENSLHARDEAVRVATALRARGRPLDGVRILQEAIAKETDPGWRLRFAELMSDLLEDAGDHREAIAILQGAVDAARLRPGSSDQVRVARRLGVHFHRAGEPRRAQDCFSKVHRFAVPARHSEDLILVESELAELHTLRGEYAEAEAACARGLEWLRTTETSPRFRGAMEVMLRGSLGHLELRRMRFDRAEAELSAAELLARRHSTAAVRARILNNLGVLHNHRGDLDAARRAYSRAQQLLARIGDERGVVLAMCNLAIIAAKTGDPEAGRGAIDEATALVEKLPDPRLELYVDLATGLVAHARCDAAAAPPFRRAIDRARALGDAQFAAFAEVYLAETEICCARYTEALNRLRAAATCSSKVPGLARMARTRRAFVEALLGRADSAKKTERSLDETPRTDVALLEAWNDLVLAATRSILGEPTADIFRRARLAFHELGVPAGERLAIAGELWAAVQEANRSAVQRLQSQLQLETPEPNRLLAVLQPIVLAEASIFLADEVAAKSLLEAAAGAIVGAPFLELDWRIEHLRASLERRRGHRDEARRLLHRALHTRDLIASFLPTRLRRRFLAQDRFRCLRDLEARLATVSPTPLRGGRRDELSQLGLVAHSQSMRAVCETVLRLRDQEIPVLITGETGAGKEVLARAIHRLSPRRNDRFQPLFLASVPVELFEAEVFGHEAGAFTGAEESRPGLLEHLAGGTLFLDEVSALAQEVQAKLLRAIESGAVRRVGALEARPIDVRFLAATSADLDAEVEKGAFRRDLYYRLAAVHIRVPPLRERREDIPELIAQLVEAHSRRLGVPAVSLPPASFDALVAHDWPGNVRQLESVIVRMLVGRAKPEDVGSYLDVARGGEAAPAARQLFDAGLLRGRSLTELHRELDREYLAMLFQRTRGDLHAMASTLEIKLANLYHWLRRVGLDIRVLRRGLRTRK